MDQEEKADVVVKVVRVISGMIVMKDFMIEVVVHKVGLVKTDSLAKQMFFEAKLEKEDPLNSLLNILVGLLNI
jgi:hypothetical protein